MDQLHKVRFKCSFDGKRPVAEQMDGPLSARGSIKAKQLAVLLNELEMSFALGLAEDLPGEPCPALRPCQVPTKYPTLPTKQAGGPGGIL